jgi:hypothetical protein
MNRLVVLLGLLAGCGDEPSGPVVHDLAVNHDLTVNMGVPIGGQCLTSTDCKTGQNPACRKNKGTRTGVCTADCFIDDDCGTGNVCLFQPPAGDTMNPGACAKPCQLATDCTEGIGCWVSLDKEACWPLNGVQDAVGPIVLNCDPTVAGCTFPGSALPGGCSRQIVGTGSAGSCRQGCDIGVGTCPTASGFVQNCYFLDETHDAMNMPTGDALKQTICVVDVPVGNPPAFIADGVECLDPDSGSHFFDICFPGSQCETFTSNGTMADNKCHKLCYLGNFTPPDMGPLFTDGGIDGTCPGGQTCTDVFNSASATSPSMPVGLCK